jgi:hypothetical protein
LLAALVVSRGTVGVASRTELADLDAALVRIVAVNRPITVRGVFYRAVAEGLVPKDETKGYRLVQRRLLKLRENLDIPYGWITDGSRTRFGHRRYGGTPLRARTFTTLASKREGGLLRCRGRRWRMGP